MVLSLLKRDYLSREVLDGFDRYKYNSVDTSPLSNYVMHPFWNWAVRFCPSWVAPNLLTLVGFLCCLAHYLIPAYYDYGFTASTHGSDHPIPRGAWFATSFLLFASHTLDGIDGKQARKTGTSSPLGELFDHGCDAWAAVFITSTFYDTFGRNVDGYSIPVFRMYCALWNVFLCFHISHWEKYNTGVMYLPWGYDMSMVSGTLLYLLTGVLGHEAWKLHLPFGMSMGALLEFTLYAGSAGLAIPTALRNIYRSYRDSTGKMRSFGEAMRPLLAFSIAMGILLAWATLSPTNILDADPRLFFYVSGTVFANICCRLIVAQMADVRADAFNAMLWPLGLAAFAGIYVPGLDEVMLVIILACLFTVMHVHYCVCVIRQMCRHLGINAFSIGDRGQPRPKED